MAEAWNRVKLPKISHVCCGFLYETTNAETSDYFRCFAHKSLKEKMADINGNFFDIKFCITFWLVCKNNECITSFTFYYGKTNKLISQVQKKGINYLLSLKDKFLANIPLKIKFPKLLSTSKNYLWRYTDHNPNKKFISNIYNLDDVKVGETEVQKVKTYKINDIDYK